MKKLALLSLLLCLALLCACGGNTVTAADASLSDVCTELLTATGEENAVTLNRDYISIYYGLDESMYEEAAAFMVPRNILQSEVVLVKAGDSAGLEEIQAALNLRLDSLREQARDYDTESAALLEHTEVFSKAPYCAVFFHPMQKELQAAFEAHLKEYAEGEAPVFTPAPTAEPAPESTTKPTEAPAEEPEREPKEKLPYGLVPGSERVDDSWFDDAIIIGNSVAKNLENYVVSQRLGSDPACMGKAVFFTAGRYCWKNAAINAYARPTYNGQYYTPVDIVKEVNAHKIILALSQIDLIFQGRSVEETLDYAVDVLTALKEECDEPEIYVCGMSPRASLFEGQPVNNAFIRDYNEKLLACCEENQVYYLDCYTPLADKDGCLAEAYRLETSDGGIHLTPEGCRVWMEYLYTHTA